MRYRKRDARTRSAGLICLFWLFAAHGRAQGYPAKPVRCLVPFSAGSGGIGTPTFVAGELFESMAAVDLLHAPYQSGGEAISGIVTGEVSLYFAPLATALPHVRPQIEQLAKLFGERRVPVN